MKKKILLILIPLIIILAGGSLGAYYVYDSQINIDTIYPGLEIDEFYVGGMTKSDALNYIERSKEDELLGSNMKLSYEDHVYNIGLKDLDYSYDYEKAVNEAYEVGREGKLFQRYKEIRQLKDKGFTIALESNYNKSKIDQIVEDISKELHVESKDAEFNFNGGNFLISDEAIGRKVDSEELGLLIKDNIEELADIEIPMEIIQPKYTKEYYARINGVVGQYSTDFKNSGLGRKKNIQLSASSLNGKILHPGQSISYNETTGPRQKQFGYEEAPVIIGGELTPGIGGGVCQTSTTLYNALLLADLTILERHPHSIPPAYINKGQDAAVATGYLDLRFRNDFDYPIYISAWVAGDRVYFSIYGDRNAKDYTVSIQPELLETIPHQVIENEDPGIEPGTRELIEQGRDGYKVRTFKSIIKGGKVIERKQISSDYYRERNYLYKVGPKKPETPREAEEREGEPTSEEAISEEGGEGEG